MAIKVKSLNNLSKDKEYMEAAKGKRPKIADTVNKMINGDGKTHIKIEDVEERMKWSLICSRYTNDFDYDPEQDAKLIDEVEEFGLQHAIILVKIDNYLALENVPEEAKNYYEKAKEKGYEYYILSGHRRSRAVMSLCCGKQVGLNRTEFDKWYKKKFDNLTWEEVEQKNKWAVVKYQEYSPKTVEEEERLTQIENFSNRVIQTFTWVYNSYKLLNEKEKATAEDVTKYVNETYGVQLGSGHIANYLTIIKSFKDQRYIRAIFEGVITPYTAKTITPFYNKNLANNDELRDEVIKELHAHTEDQEKYIEQLLGKKKQKKSKAKKEKLTKKVVLDLCDKVIRKEITIEEVIAIINQKY